MDSLRKWLTQQGVVIHPALHLVQDSTGSRVEALADIDSNQILARIPKRIVLSAQTCSLPRLLPSAHVETLAQLPPVLRLAVHVTHELLVRVSSTWAAYLAQCPPFETVPLPLLWEKGSTARRWSAGTELEKELVRTDHDLEFLRSFFISTALPLLSARRCIAPPPTLPTFLHAYLLVSTRAFLVDAFHGLSLVPLADLFNHEQESTHNAHFASDQWVCSECGRFSSCSHDEDAGKAGSDDNEEDDDSCEMVSICPIAAGEEVFNHYGSQMSNAKLAVHYGFVLEANDHDLVSYSLLECVAACSAVPPASTTLDPPLASQLETLIAVPELLHGLSPDDPLVAWFPSSGGFDTSSTSFLSFDADARLSPALALLVAISALSSSSSIPELSHILDFMHALDRTAKSAVPLTPAHEEAFDRACLVVEKLVSSRIERQHEPALTASALLDMAQSNESSTCLALSFLASERVLLASVREQWNRTSSHS